MRIIFAREEKKNVLRKYFIDYKEKSPMIRFNRERKTTTRRYLYLKFKFNTKESINVRTILTATCQFRFLQACQLLLKSE